MFLNQLSTPLQKSLFLELALLIMMAAGDDNHSDMVVESDLSQSNLSQRTLLKNISQSEEIMLFEYQHELFSRESGTQRMRFLENILDEASEFGQALEKATQEILETHVDDIDIKQDVMQILITSGEDILQLIPEKVQAVMVGLPQIREEILVYAVNELIAHKQDLGLQLSTRERKIILFELIGTGFSSGSFEQAEKELLQVICAKLGIDAEYIDEFTEIMSNIFAANKEAADLINE